MINSAKEIFGIDLLKKYKAVVIRGKNLDIKEKTDIDIVIPFGKSVTASSEFISLFRKKGWKIISYRRIPYLISIIIYHPNIYPSHSLKIDFFDGVGWCGIVENKFERALFSIERKDSIIEDSLTIIHKLTYAGTFSKKDINIVRDNIDESLKILKIHDLISKEQTLSGKKISLFKKWKLRHRLSGHKGFLFLKWLLRVVQNSLKIKFLPINSFNKSFVVFHESCIGIKELFDDLEGIYTSSGDKIVPKIISLKDGNKFRIKLFATKIESFSNSLFFFIDSSSMHKYQKKYIKYFFSSIELGKNSKNSSKEILINYIDESIYLKIIEKFR
jgi:hypothetical protein